MVGHGTVCCGGGPVRSTPWSIVMSPIQRGPIFPATASGRGWRLGVTAPGAPLVCFGAQKHLPSGGHVADVCRQVVFLLFLGRPRHRSQAKVCVHVQGCCSAPAADDCKMQPARAQTVLEAGCWRCRHHHNFDIFTPLTPRNSTASVMSCTNTSSGTPVYGCVFACVRVLCVCVCVAYGCSQPIRASSAASCHQDGASVTVAARGLPHTHTHAEVHLC